MAASAFVINHTWPKLLGLCAGAGAGRRANKPEPRCAKPSGHIIIPRINSQLCDRYVFDNASGQVNKAETSLCRAASKKPEVNITDQINSFHSSWRGVEGRRPGAPRDAVPAKK